MTRILVNVELIKLVREYAGLESLTLGWRFKDIVTGGRR
jgi:hypothetical protein